MHLSFTFQLSRVRMGSEYTIIYHPCVNHREINVTSTSLPYSFYVSLYLLNLFNNSSLVLIYSWIFIYYVQTKHLKKYKNIFNRILNPFKITCGKDKIQHLRLANMFHMHHVIFYLVEPPT